MEGNLYYNHDFLRENKIAPADLSNFIREWALSTGYFQAGFSREQILDGRAPGDLGERVRNGFNAARSGDMVLVYKPYTLSAWQPVQDRHHPRLAAIPTTRTCR